MAQALVVVLWAFDCTPETSSREITSASTSTMRHLPDGVHIKRVTHRVLLRQPDTGTAIAAVLKHHRTRRQFGTSAMYATVHRIGAFSVRQRTDSLVSLRYLTPGRMARWQSTTITHSKTVERYNNMNSTTIVTTVLFPALVLSGCSYFGDEIPGPAKVIGEATTPQMITAQTPSVVSTINESVLFNVGSDQISSTGGKAIDSIANVLVADRLLRVRVRGYADTMGSRDSNQLLSERRAMAVSHRLVQQGVAHVQINTLGVGTAEPSATNTTATGREQNRRVRITVTAPQSLSNVDPV
jgi:outer membrane protein OmpA-like peptidoglycan-associated protein